MGSYETLRLVVATFLNATGEPMEPRRRQIIVHGTSHDMLFCRSSMPRLDEEVKLAVTCNHSGEILRHASRVPWVLRYFIVIGGTRA